MSILANPCKKCINLSCEEYYINKMNCEKLETERKLKHCFTFGLICFQIRSIFREIHQKDCDEEMIKELNSYKNNIIVLCIEIGKIYKTITHNDIHIKYINLLCELPSVLYITNKIEDIIRKDINNEISESEKFKLIEELTKSEEWTLT